MNLRFSTSCHLRRQSPEQCIQAPQQSLLPVGERWRSRRPSPLLVSLLTGGALLLTAQPVHADPTPANTTITNQAGGSFEDPTAPGSPINVESNSVTVTVAEIAGITLQPSGPASEAPSGVNGASSTQGNGQINPEDVVYFTFTMTNVGNDPSQFFIPDAPNSITNGSFNSGSIGPIEILNYDPDGAGPAAAVDLSSSPIAIPTGGIATGDPSILGSNGSFNPNGSLTIRVPIKVDALSGSFSDGDSITVTMGNTPAPNTQNQPLIAGSGDVRTQDNSGTDNGDVNGAPVTSGLNGEREASASQSAVVTTAAADYGDAPDLGAGNGSGNYETLAVNNGPKHFIANGLFLGAGVSADSDAFSNGIDSSGNGSDDSDDGVLLGGSSLQGQSLTQNQSSTITITTAGTITTTGTSGLLQAWADWNQNGLFDPGEQIATNLTDGGTGDGDGTVNNQISLNLTPPSSAATGDTYVRFRYSSTSNLGPQGNASDGEVEDYHITILDAGQPNVLLVKRITAINGSPTSTNGDDLSRHIDDPNNPADDITALWPNPNSSLIGGLDGGDVRPGDEIEYSIYFLSNGQLDANGVLLCDRIPNNVDFIPNSFTSSSTPDPSGLPTADRGILLRQGSSELALSNVDDGDRGRYFPPNSPVSLPASAPHQPNCGGSNSNGAILVNLGTLPTATAPGSPANASGYIRFRGKVR